MKIGEKVKLLRQQKGLSPEKLAMTVGIAGSYIRRIEKENRSPTLETARKLAKGLGVSVAALVDESDLPPQPVASPETALSDLEVSIKAYVPVYGEVSAGEGVEPIDYVATTRARPAPDSLKAFRVKGLCLDPEIHEGDTVIVDNALSPQNDDLVIVIIDGQASIKRYRDDGRKKWLENNNGHYQPEDVHQVGVVVEFNRKRR